MSEQADCTFYEQHRGDVVFHGPPMVSHPNGGSETQVNQYKLSKQLGSGSFARVFRATAPDPDNDSKCSTYAVKVINKKALEKKREWKQADGDGSPQLVSLFDRVITEVQIWEQLRCPNIIGLKEVLDDDKTASLYLIMEHAHFGQIMVWQPSKFSYTCPRIEEGVQLPHELARHYFRDVIAAVHYLHECNIVHRDIKPENILVNHHHVCKLCDFGEAERFDPIVNESGMLVETKGTHQFFPPECCRGGVPPTTNNGVVTFGASAAEPGAEAKESETAAADKAVEFSGYAADMWAVGVSLFACLFGILPFYATEPVQLFEMIGRCEIAWPKLEEQLEQKVINPKWPASMAAHTKSQLDSVLRFLKALLCSDPQERMTATVAMSDPWLTFDGHVPIECSPLELAAPAARPGRRFSHRSPSASTNSRFSTRSRRSVARRSMHSRRSSASSRRSSKSPRPQTSKARKCVIQ